MFLSKPGWADLNSANLTPASGRQDHTTSPYAATSLVRSLGDRSQAFRQPALQPRRAQNAAASTASHPASVTIAIRPSVGRDGDSSRSDLGQREQVFFGKSERKDSTTLSTNRPTGKSPHVHNRDRCEPHDSSPPTPPYIRVRIRRCPRLSRLGHHT